jgi:hypothetical protein
MQIQCQALMTAQYENDVHVRLSKVVCFCEKNSNDTMQMKNKRYFNVHLS